MRQPQTPKAGLSVIALGLALVSTTLAASLQQIANFGPNPTNASFYLYVPDSFVAGAPLLVYPHWCHGTAQDAFRLKPWRGLADRLGFVTIYPSTPWTTDYCWDVSSSQTLTHDGGGDSLGIASMVRWTLAHHAVDPDRVFVAGVSSGAMMTNVLVGAYPELFAAGSASAGVPFGCFAGPGYNVWSSPCAEGKITRSAAEWAALVKGAYPSYAGPRPKIQLLHGSADDVLNVVNFREEVKMWTEVLGTGAAPTLTVADTPRPGWTKSVYGTAGLVESFLASGVTHDIPDLVDEVIRFFGLDCAGADCFSRKCLARP